MSRTPSAPNVMLDPRFPDHPKILAAGPLAAWLHVAGICYANRHLTDGFIPVGQLTHLCALPANVGGLAERLARDLVDVGLWHEADGGFEIHDYAHYQPTRSFLEERREHWRTRKRRQREQVSRGNHAGQGGVTRESRGTSAVKDSAVESVSSPSASASAHGELPISQGPLTWSNVHERLAGSDDRTQVVICSIARSGRLPEAALHSAYEALELRRRNRAEPPLQNEARYFVAILNEMVKDGRYLAREAAA